TAKLTGRALRGDTPRETIRKGNGMSVILTKAVIQQGQVIVANPIDLPDGTEVVISASPNFSEDDFETGWDNSPEGIASWLEWYNSLEPLIFTAEEETVFIVR